MKPKFKSLKEAYDHFKSHVPRELTAIEEIQAKTWFASGVAALTACINNNVDPVKLMEEANAMADSCKIQPPKKFQVDTSALDRLGSN